MTATSFVLILITWWSGAVASTQMITQEFNSEEKCLQAVSTLRKNNSVGISMAAWCVEK